MLVLLGQFRPTGGRGGVCFGETRAVFVCFLGVFLAPGECAEWVRPDSLPGKAGGSKSLSRTGLGQPGSVVLGHVLVVPSPTSKTKSRKL